MYAHKVVFALILFFFSKHEIQISMYMLKKADKSYMYFLYVYVKIKIRKSVEKNFGKFSSFAYFKHHTFWKNLGKISDVYNLSEIVFPSFAYFCTDPEFSRIVEVHKLSEILFPSFSYFVLTHTV